MLEKQKQRKTKVIKTTEKDNDFVFVPETELVDQKIEEYAVEFQWQQQDAQMNDDYSVESQQEQQTYPNYDDQYYYHQN